MFNKNKFRAKCIEHDMKFTDVARVMGVSLVTLYRKANGASDFTRSEIQVLKERLGLSADEVEHIFFD